MAARSGMANLTRRLRRMVDDIVVASETGVWDDDQLEDILDEHKIRVHREYLEMERTLVSASDYEYKVYHSRHGNFEEGGTAYFQVEGAGGTQRGTADYSVDYVRGVVTMTADQGGSALYLTGWSYDLDYCAAELWRERAGMVSSFYDAAFGDQKVSRSQWFKHCQQMAEMYAQRAKPVVARGFQHGVFG